MKNLFNTANLLGMAVGIPAGVKTMGSIIAYSHEYASLTTHLAGDVVAIAGGLGMGYGAYKLTSAFVNAVKSVELSHKGLEVSFKNQQDKPPAPPSQQPRP